MAGLVTHAQTSRLAWKTAPVKLRTTAHSGRGTVFVYRFQVTRVLRRTNVVVQLNVDDRIHSQK